MGDRMKRLVSWLLAMFLVASVVTGCQAGSPSGEGWQDRAAIQQQDTAVQEAARRRACQKRRKAARRRAR